MHARLLLLAVSFSLFASGAAAQEPPKDPLSRFGLDLTLAVPVDDWAEVSDVSLGGMLRFEHLVIPRLAITARAGYLHDLGVQEGVTLGHVPILGGARYHFMEGDHTPWVGAELGLAIWWGEVTVTTPFGTASESDTEVELALALSGGYRAGMFSFGGGLYVPSADDAFGLFVTAGLDFARF